MLLPVGTKVELRKEPTNTYDNEAIGVWIQRGNEWTQDGYVSAFYKTRLPGTISAGRLIDKIGDKAPAVIVEVTKASIHIAEVRDEVTEVLP